MTFVLRIALALSFCVWDFLSVLLVERCVYGAGHSWEIGDQAQLVSRCGLMVAGGRESEAVELDIIEIDDCLYIHVIVLVIILFRRR